MYGLTVPRSTLYRHLKQANATRIKLGVLCKKVCNDRPAIIIYILASRALNVKIVAMNINYSIRRECLNYIIVLNERHLRIVLPSYVAYYHRCRVHRSLDMDAPKLRSVRRLEVGPVRKLLEVGGLHHHYERMAARERVSEMLCFQRLQDFGTHRTRGKHTFKPSYPPDTVLILQPTFATTHKHIK